jgi:hypothetical protein
MLHLEPDSARRKFEKNFKENQCIFPLDHQYNSTISVDSHT